MEEEIKKGECDMSMKMENSGRDINPFGVALLVIVAVFLIALVALAVFAVHAVSDFSVSDWHSAPKLVQLLPWYEHPRIPGGVGFYNANGDRVALPGNSVVCGFYTRGCACGADNVMLWEPYVESLSTLSEHCDAFAVFIGEDSNNPIPQISKRETVGFIGMLMAKSGVTKFGNNFYIFYDKDFAMARSLGIEKDIPGVGGYSTVYFVWPSILVIDPSKNVVWIDNRNGKREIDWERPSVPVLRLFLRLKSVLGGIK